MRLFRMTQTQHKSNTKNQSKSVAKVEQKASIKSSKSDLRRGYTLPNVWESALKKRSPSGALPTASYIFTHAHAVIRPLFSPDNVRTRTHARRTVRPHFSYDNAHARASGVHLCHLRHIRAVTERIGSGYGADQSASLLYDREKSGEGERRRRLFFAPTTCAHNARARERRSTSHFYQRKSVAAHTFFRRLCAR